MAVLLPVCLCSAVLLDWHLNFNLVLGLNCGDVRLVGLLLLKLLPRLLFNECAYELEVVFKGAHDEGKLGWVDVWVDEGKPRVTTDHVGQCRLQVG